MCVFSYFIMGRNARKCMYRTMMAGAIAAPSRREQAIDSMRSFDNLIQ